MTDHAKTIRDALMWAQAYASDRLAHRLIDAEESLRDLLAGHAAEVEQLRQERDEMSGQLDWHIDKVRELLNAERERDEARGELEHWKGCNLYPSQYREAVEQLREARAENERLRQALSQHRPPSCPCKACEAVKAFAAQEPPADDDGLCPHGWPYEFCGVCHEEEAQEPPAKGDDRG